jgi:8-oxo-dGTP diphosphatase
MAKAAKKSSQQDAQKIKPKKPSKKSSSGRSRRGDLPDGPGGYVAGGRPAVVLVVDVALLAVLEGELVVLLVERQRDPDRGRWALPGVVVEPDESLPDAAARAVVARTGILEPLSRLEQSTVFDDPDRDPRTRVVSVAHLAVSRRAVPPAGGSLASGRWWAVDAVGSHEGPTLAFDHADILAAALEALRASLEQTDLATALVEEPFTLGDLRRTYDLVWGAELEPANFRRKVLTTPGFVTPHGGTRTVGTGRPADLYRRGPGATLHPPMPRPR